MKKRPILLEIAIALLLIFGLATATLADEGKNESGKQGKSSFDRKKGGKDYDSYFPQHGYSHLGIPEGHLPPPGECRIWYPGKPAGHQPPPGRCENLRHQVPFGAWLIHRPQDEPKHVDVSAYDMQRPGIVIDVGIFDAASGIFIRGGLAR